LITAINKILIIVWCHIDISHFARNIICAGRQKGGLLAVPVIFVFREMPIIHTTGGRQDNGSARIRHVQVTGIIDCNPKRYHRPAFPDRKRRARYRVCAFFRWLFG